VPIARYGYDLAGRRIAKRVYSSASGGTVAYTRFVYHGEHVAFDRQDRQDWELDVHPVEQRARNPRNHGFTNSGDTVLGAPAIRRSGVTNRGTALLLTAPRA
jgi:hypothetical protein